MIGLLHQTSSQFDLEKLSEDEVRALAAESLTRLLAHNIFETLSTLAGRTANPALLEELRAIAHGLTAASAPKRRGRDARYLSSPIEDVTEIHGSPVGSGRRSSS